MSNEILGKGLQSLIPDDYVTDSSGRETVSYVETSKIFVSDHQPRKTLDDKTVSELALSIKEHGILQPLVLSKRDDGTYQLIAGQRRLLASKKVGLLEVPAIIKIADVKNEMEMALIENIQREDLNAIEEAEGYRALIDKFSLDTKDVSEKVGKGESTIVNSLRLLTLAQEVRDAVVSGKISAGHARALITLPKEDQLKKLSEILTLGLTVRDVESRIKSIKNKGQAIERENDVYSESIENDLREVLGTKVFIQKSGKGGKIVISYYSKEELDSLVSRMKSIERIEEA